MSAQPPLSSSAPCPATRRASVVDQSAPALLSTLSLAGVSQHREPASLSVSSPPPMGAPIGRIKSNLNPEGSSPSLPALGEPDIAEDQRTPSTGSPSSHPSPLDLFMREAVAKYKAKTGIDLSAMQMPLPPESEEALTAFLEQCRENFTNSRERVPERIRTPLCGLAGVLRRFSGALGEGTALVFPAGKVVFAALGLLLQAAEGVHGDFDEIIAAFDKISGILGHIRIVARSSHPSRARVTGTPWLHSMQRSQNTRKYCRLRFIKPRVIYSMTFMISIPFSKM